MGNVPVDLRHAKKRSSKPVWRDAVQQRDRRDRQAGENQETFFNVHLHSCIDLIGFA